MDERTPRLPRHIDDDRTALAALVADLERGGWPHEYPNGYHMMPGCRGCDALRVIKAARALPPDPERLATALRTAAETTDIEDPTTVGRETHLQWAAAIIAAWPDD